MAKFAIAHLQYGSYKSRRILQSASARQMQQQQFTHDCRLPGIGWGFMESCYKQQRAINHGGSLPGFTSLLYLFPSHNLGFFVSDNGGGNIAGQLLEQFCDRYFSQKNSASSASLSEESHSLKRYEGSYRSNRYARRTFGKINLLGSTSLRLKIDTSGTLSVPETLKTPNPVSLQEVEPSFLQLRIKDKEHPNSYFVSQENNGKIKALLTANGVLEKLSWYETPTFHWILVSWFALIFLSGSVIGVVALIKFPENPQHQLAQLLAISVCGFNSIFIFGLLVVKQLCQDNYQLQLIYGVPKIVALLLCIPILTSVLAVALSITAIFTGINFEWSSREAIYYGLVSLTALGFFPFLNYWNLLGFRY